MRRERGWPTRAGWRAVASSRPEVRRILPVSQLRVETGRRSSFGPGLAALSAMPMCGLASPGRWGSRCRQHPGEAKR
jgi:hypothetical protein